MPMLLPCPICGKAPKVKVEGGGLISYPSCKIYCKPLFKKLHLGVEHFIIPCGTIDMAREKAIERWNNKVREEISKT